MTNSEKYLKDGVDVEGFIQELLKIQFFDNATDIDKVRLETFFKAEVMPTLTEDEKVILRNIDKKYKVLEIENGELRISTGRPSYNFHLFTEFQHLFQFIKERRRI